MTILRAFVLLALAAMALSSCKQHDAGKEHRYALERIVGFGTGGGSEPFRVGGWAQSDRFSTWTIGPRAQLKFLVDEQDRPLGIRMRLAGLHKVPELPSQTVDVMANGTKVATWHVARTADFTAVIPVDLLQKQPDLMIELMLPQAATPKSLGLSPDARPLGVSCFEVQITRTVSATEMWPKQFPREVTPRS